MSKSLGNTVSPQQVMQDSGAEILRLWVSMVDYRDEVRLGREVLARTVEAYRKIRNTGFRYLVSNLFDFSPDAALPDDDLLEVDRYVLARFARLAHEVRQAYEHYEFQTIFHAINEFVTVELSSFYADVSKDRLYTFRADSRERRSAQTAYYAIADGLARLLAPILSVTADEVWSQLPGTREASVHLAEFPASLDRWRNADLETRWRRLLDVRAEVNQALEGARQQKTIGSALAAHVTLQASGADADVLERYADDLPMIFITSAVTIARRADGPLVVTVAPAPGAKCPRCWRFVTDAISGGDTDGLCGRCADVVGGVVASRG
jgi:isoleucyl-tRNA synthetase